jgi:Flp pilus assembly protein TadD
MPREIRDSGDSLYTFVSLRDLQSRGCHDGRTKTLNDRVRHALSCFAILLMAAIGAGCASDPLAESVHIGQGVARGSGGKAGALARVAAASLAGGDLATASSLYRQAHSLDPGNTRYLIGLGTTLARLGQFEEAAETFDRAVKADPGNADAMHGYGNALIALDRPDAAVSQFEAALSLKEEARSLNGIGVAHDMMGDHVAAQAHYRTALVLEPANLTVRNNLALSLAVAGKFDQAIAILRRAITDPRSGARHRLNLALVYGLAGESAAAAEIARIDLDEESVMRNLAYYRTLRALDDSRAAINAIGAHGGFAFGKRRHAP